MRVRRFVLIAAVVSAGLGVTACGKSGTPAPPANANGSTGAATGDTCMFSGVTLTPAGGVTLSGSATYDKIKSAGRVVIGVKADQPNLGYKDATGQRCGFDIEIAQLVAARLGIAKDKIEYKEIPSANRETAIKGGEIDYYVGTYSITAKRKADVSFAGPYFVAGQDLLVRKDDTSITGKDTLKGKKVCSATGSTPLQRVRDQKLTEEQNISEFKTYSECVSQLLDKRIDAVTTDDAILKGYAAQNPTKLRVVGTPFSVEKYGIGLARDDKALRNFIDDLLVAAAQDGTWAKIYAGTLGRSGSAATPPQVERY